MNQKLFIAGHVDDTLRVRLEGPEFYDRYGDGDLAEKDGPLPAS